MLPFLRQIRQLECLVLDCSCFPIAVDTLAEIPKLPHLKKLVIKKPLTPQMIAQLEGVAYTEVYLLILFGNIGIESGFLQLDVNAAAKIRTDSIAALLRLPNKKRVFVHYSHTLTHKPGANYDNTMIRCAELRQLVPSEGWNLMTLEVSTDFLKCKDEEDEELVEILSKMNLRKLYVRVSSTSVRRMELIEKYIPSYVIHKF